MVYQEDGSLRRGVERALRDARPSIADYAFHIVVTDPSDAALSELPGLVAEGHAGLKVFMVMKQFGERTADFLRLYAAAKRALDLAASGLGLLLVSQIGRAHV